MHYVYSAFGELLGIQDAQANDLSANPPLRTSFGFTGREHDPESGLMYYRARYYDPTTGRFLQQDPEPGRVDIPATAVNSYSYAANSPVNLTDSSGKSFWTDILRPFLEALLVAVVSVVTFGAIDAVLAGALGTVAAVSGGIVAGGLTGGAIAALSGEDFGKGFIIGALIGLTAISSGPIFGKSTSIFGIAIPKTVVGVINASITYTACVVATASGKGPCKQGKVSVDQ